MIIFSGLIIIFILTSLHIRFFNSKEITKENYDKKCEITKQREFNRIKRKINIHLNRLYAKFSVESKYNFDQSLIEEYLKKLHFENLVITKWHGDSYIRYEFEIR